jgi:hypothetical protein
MQTREKLQKGKRMRNEDVNGNGSKIRKKKFWEELITYFLSTQHRPYWRREVGGEGVWRYTDTQTTRRSYKPPNRNWGRGNRKTDKKVNL